MFPPHATDAGGGGDAQLSKAEGRLTLCVEAATVAAVRQRCNEILRSSRKRQLCSSRRLDGRHERVRFGLSGLDLGLVGPHVDLKRVGVMEPRVPCTPVGPSRQPNNRRH
jgi:hypothetical protein